MMRTRDSAISNDRFNNRDPGTAVAIVNAASGAGWQPAEGLLAEHLAGADTFVFSQSGLHVDQDCGSAHAIRPHVQ
jgi:hypothetical protein